MSPSCPTCLGLIADQRGLIEYRGNFQPSICRCSDSTLDLRTINDELDRLEARIDGLSEVVHQLVGRFREQETELYIASKAAEELIARNEVLETLITERNPSKKDN